MFRFSSLALASVAALGFGVAHPNESRADFDLRIGVGRSYFEVGNNPRVVVAPPVVAYPVRSAPVYVEPSCHPYGPPPVVVTPSYYPYPAGYRYGPTAPPYRHSHYDHGHHHQHPYGR